VAVAQVESQMTANARSRSDARGLLQVLPSTATALRLDVDRPASNVLAGARYLRQLLDEFHSTDLALAAYNAGPTAVARAGGAPNTETLTYAENVTDIWRLLPGCAGIRVALCHLAWRLSRSRVAAAGLGRSAPQRPRRPPQG